jgi:hypothetical protein
VISTCGGVFSTQICSVATDVSSVGSVTVSVTSKLVGVPSSTVKTCAGLAAVLVVPSPKSQRYGAAGLRSDEALPVN